MDIFGWIARKKEAVIASLCRGYKSFTGQATFEDADRLYDDVMKRFEEHKKYYNKEVNKLSSQIQKEVDSINNSKKIIKTELFPAFAEKMNKLIDVSIKNEYRLENYEIPPVNVDYIKPKEELYSINFKKNPIKSNFYAIITAGIKTRKEAKETLRNVEEEKKRLETEMAQMDSNLEKLRRIKESLELIEEYFDDLIEIYSSLLNRLDNSVNFLIIRCICITHKLTQQKMSIKNLPISQQKEIVAIVTISKILKAMVDKGFTLDGKIDTIAKNVDDAKNEINKYKEDIINKAA